VSRKASAHAVHRSGDSLCRHAGTAVRSLGTLLWKALWKTGKVASCLGGRSAQAVHRRFFDLGTTRLVAISYPHWEFNVLRQPGTLPGLGEAASRSSDLPGARVRRQLSFEHVFERLPARAAADSGCGRPGPGNRRVSRSSQRGGRRPARRAAGRHLGDDHCCGSRTRRPDREVPVDKQEGHALTTAPPQLRSRDSARAAG
jgi:hypothetical protein